MLSSQLEQHERREVMRQDADLRKRGATLHAFAESDAALPHGRFAQVSAATVIASRPEVASAYPAASAAHQIQLPDEPPLDLDNPALEQSSLTAQAPDLADAPSPSTPLSDVQRAGSSSPVMAAHCSQMASATSLATDVGKGRPPYRRY